MAVLSAISPVTSVPILVTKLATLNVTQAATNALMPVTMVSKLSSIHCKPSPTSLPSPAIISLFDLINAFALSAASDIAGAKPSPNALDTSNNTPRKLLNAWFIGPAITSANLPPSSPCSLTALTTSIALFTTFVLPSAKRIENLSFSLLTLTPNSLSLSNSPVSASATASAN